MNGTVNCNTSSTVSGLSNVPNLLASIYIYIHISRILREFVKVPIVRMKKKQKLADRRSCRKRPLRKSQFPEIKEKRKYQTIFRRSKFVVDETMLYRTTGSRKGAPLDFPQDRINRTSTTPVFPRAYHLFRKFLRGWNPFFFLATGIFSSHGQVIEKLSIHG